jgi:hypothetical protein
MEQGAKGRERGSIVAAARLCYNACMILPAFLPAWLPWWVPLAVLVPLSLYALLFLLMPFSVFGVKGRLDIIEARLDELHGEVRTLILRMPQIREAAYSDPETAARDVPRPPIAPAPTAAPVSRQPSRRAAVDTADDEYDDEPPRPQSLRPEARSAPRAPSPRDPPRQRPPAREEPRLDWPR